MVVNFFMTTSIATKLVQVQRIGKITLMGLNRPDKRNCINSEASRQLHDAFLEFEACPESSVAILYGKGGNFCAGYDLQELSQNNDLSHFKIGPNKISDRISRSPIGPARLMLSKPTIAAVSGYAVAGGLELALMCDLRVMEDNAIMGVFCRRFGVPLIDGGTVRLPKIVGLGRALDLVMTGRPVTAKEALEIGLATKICKRGTAVGVALSLAFDILRFPQKCLGVDRASLYNSTYDAPNIQEALRYEFSNGVSVMTEESIEGAQLFANGFGRAGNFNLRRPSAPTNADSVVDKDKEITDVVCED